MHPAAVGVPAEVRSCTGRGAQEKLARLRMAGGRGSVFSGVKRNGTEQAQGLGLIDLWRQVPNKEERQWEPLGRKCSGAREPVCRSSDSVSVGAGPSCSHREPLHCSGESGAAPLCLVKHLCAILWSLQHVQCNSHSKLFPKLLALPWCASPACQEGAEPAQVERCLQPWSGWLVLVPAKEAVHGEKSFQVQ